MPCWIWSFGRGKPLTAGQAARAVAACNWRSAPRESSHERPRGATGHTGRTGRAQVCCGAVRMRGGLTATRSLWPIWSSDFGGAGAGGPSRRGPPAGLPRPLRFELAADAQSTKGTERSVPFADGAAAPKSSRSRRCPLTGRLHLQGPPSPVPLKPPLYLRHELFLAVGSPRVRRSKRKATSSSGVPHRPSQFA